MIKSKFFIALLWLLAAASNVDARDRTKFATDGTCDGLPRMPVKTFEGFCLALFAEGFSFPRGILPQDNGDVLLVDMGSWGKKKGSLWRVSNNAGTVKKQRLLDGLDRPHAIVKSPEGLIYLASVDKISIVQLEGNAATLIDVIGGNSIVPGLPTTGRHPLKQITFNSSGDIFVNIGSESDNCEVEGQLKKAKRGICLEATGWTQRGAIRKYRAIGEGRFHPKWEVFASGLRNSMGLDFEPLTGTLWQVENARDSISNVDSKLDDSSFPHDELNLIRQGANFGWPYCYDMGVASPEYSDHDCSNVHHPALLLPPHSAPLGLAFHNGTGLPKGLKKGAFITLHGYRKTGHRVVFVAVDDYGHPSGDPLDIVWGWDGSESMSRGAPVDIRRAKDGAMYISDDRNGLLLRLSYRVR